MNQYLLLTLSVLTFTQTFAITVSWDGGAGNNLWSEEKNWSDDVTPQAGEDVKIDAGFSVLMNISATIQSLRIEDVAELEVGTGQTLLVTAPMNSAPQAIYLKNAALNILGIVNINNYVGHGVFVDVGGVLKNISRLLISGTVQGKGIVNYGDVALLGHLEITNIDSGGIYNAGKFTVEDSVIISHTNIDQEHGIHNVLNFIIAASGVVSIESIAGGYSSYGLQNEASLLNKGQLLTSMTGGLGIYNDGLVTNEGDITVQSAPDFGIKNDSIIINQPSGSIVISDITTFESGFALWNQGYYQNRGLTKIFACSAGGLRNEGRFDNTDSLVLKETSGIAVRNQDSLCNAGLLVIDSVSNYGYGIENTGTLLNDGTITISDLEAQAIYNLSGGLLVNQDSVVIRDCTHAINNVSDSITNSSSGVIQIKDVDTAMTGETPSTYINHGQIHIENVSSGITVSGHFFNGVGADILGAGIIGTILSASVGGFYQAEFTNLGTLSLSP